MCIHHEEVLLLFGVAFIVLYVWTLLVSLALYRQERTTPATIEIPSTSHFSRRRPSRR